ncbi:response regulator [Nannocystis radixulma]|uniref:Response regulator transcription factor n=1 Tax=Nannocystis radixulma TaxID=2995305 RepID=A0ABT5BDV3_9BACT|nr:response regulator transcription factor [Nannocystis radixulma]MDC0672316.1 response regulator transcription factor [Nannocystis radixulma]
MIRVFLADDHVVLSRGLQLMLESTGEMTVVGTAGDGLEVLDAPALASCDVLILDLNLPRLSGSEVLRRLRERRPELPVIVLSMYAEDAVGLHLLRDGAAAYLSKHRPPEELIAAIHRVVRGRPYVPDTLAEQALSGPKSGPELPHAQLTPREHQVFVLLLQGRSASEVAAELDLHASTVSNNIRRIKEKLGARTIGDIVGYGHRHGLIH